jgi:hypothetical protein
LLLAVDTASFRVVMWDLTQPDPKPVAAGVSVGERGVAFSPDGALVALGRSVWKLERLKSARYEDAPDAKIPAEFTSDTNMVAFSADSKRLVVSTAEGEFEAWSIADLANPQKEISGVGPGANKPAGQSKPLTYSLNWQWSRFNEDFGEVKPPPTKR